MIEIQDLSVKYRHDGKTFEALSSLNLKIEYGDYLAIIGPNGSGKSTLVKALCGLIVPDSGSITIMGQKVIPGNFGRDFFAKVALVFQEPQGQFLMPSVEIEIKTVLENLGLTIEKQRLKFNEIVHDFSLSEIIYSKPDELSGGQMQIVNLACALAVSPQVLILDEPTTFLDPSYRKQLLDFLEKFHHDGLTVIHVTQYPDEALRADKVCIIDRGILAIAGKSAEILSSEQVLSAHGISIPQKISCRKYLGINLESDEELASFEKSLKTAEAVKSKSGVLSNAGVAEVISIQDLKFSYRKNGFLLDIPELKLRKNEITALIGPTGCGKSTLAWLISGLIKPHSGQLALSGKPLTTYSNIDLRKMIGLTWQLPDLALIGPTIEDDLIFSLENLGIDNADISDILSRVRLSGFENRIVDSLSGGEKRKLQIANILATNPQIIILDEPSAFLDPMSQAELADIIKSFKSVDRSLLVIGHDLHFISDVADRVIGMQAGLIKYDVPSNEFFDNPEYLSKIDMPVDPAIKLRQAIMKKNILLPFSSLNISKIADYLKNNGFISTDFS